MGTAHPSPETISLYLEGWLTPAEVEGLGAHFASCETCRKQVDEAKRQREAHPGVGKPSSLGGQVPVTAAPQSEAHRAPERLLPEIPSVPIVIPRQWGPLVALALVGVVAVAGGVLWLLSEDGAGATVIAQSEPAPPAPTAAEPSTDSGALPPDGPPPPAAVEVALEAPVAETAPLDAGLETTDSGLPSADSGAQLAEPARALALVDAGSPSGEAQVHPGEASAGGLPPSPGADAGHRPPATSQPALEQVVDTGHSLLVRPAERTPRTHDGGVPRVTPQRSPAGRPAAPPPPQPSNDPLEDWH